MSDRTKEQKRRTALTYRGNATVIEAVVGPVWAYKSPNRRLEQHRSSNRGKRVS